MSRPASTSSIRVGAQVYQISLTPAQLEQRHVDKQRERRISRETSKRRKALEERRRQTQVREERERQNELMKRRERQREATERYQRAHIPHQSRRRFASPVLRSPIYPQAFRRTSTETPPQLDATLKEIRGYYCESKSDEAHARRTVQKQHEFTQQLAKQQQVTTKQPVPPPHPKPVPPPPPTKHLNAWNEPDRAPSRCDQREESDESPKTSEDDLESTFTVHKDPVSRASTPEVPNAMRLRKFMPAPPVAPRPELADPRVRQIEVLNVASAPALIDGELRQEQESQESRAEQTEPSDMGGDAGRNQQIEYTSILKQTSSTRRRVVSATKNQGLVAASIRDSLDLVGRKLDKPTKSVKWDRLYYNDSTIAEFGGDNWRPVPVKETVTKKRGRGKATPKQQEKAEKGAGKRSTKTSKADGQKTQHEITMSRQMGTYTSNAIVVPTPSAGASNTPLRTETPLIKPDYDYTESSRIPMPPKAQRPLTSRTQIIRSKRFKSNNSPASPMKVKGYSTNQTSDGQMIVNSNNQVNIHIGSVEINENLEKTPTDQEINWLWERVRSALEEQPVHQRPKSAPKSSRQPKFSKSMGRPSSATMNGSTSQFLLAEKMARHGATDDHIMGVIGEQMPVTQLSLEEQQIQESLIRLDNRLNNIQGNKSNRRYQMNAFQR